MLQQAELEVTGEVASSDYSFAEVKTTGESLHMRILDPLDDAVWDHLVALHPDAGCFHTSGWAKVLHRTYKHQPFYLQFSRGGRLSALIPMMEVRSPFTGRRGVSLPFSDACEPLIFAPEVIGSVTEHLVRLARERHWKYVEIRGGKLFHAKAEAATKFYAHTLDLRGGADELMSRFASPVRRAIRKAERSGVSAVIVRDREAISEFYRLHVQTRRRHGLPPQPASFFFNIYEHVIRQGLGFVVLARRESGVVAAAIFFLFGKNALFKYGASDKRFQRFRANNLVMWHGIQTLVDAGAEHLSFGRTECENSGLRRFKLSWGTEEETLAYCRVGPSGRGRLAPVRHGSGLHNKIFGKLPLVFNRLAGSMIYSHLD